MGEPSMRQLDRDLPRITVFSPAFLARQRGRKQPDCERDIEKGKRADRAAEIEAATQDMVAAMQRARDEANRLVEVARGHAVMLVTDAEMKAEEILKRAGLAVNDGDKPKVADIIREVAGRHGISVGRIKGPTRQKHVVAIRHEAIARVYIARPDLSLPAIGRLFGNRDHTTVIYAIRKAGVDRRPKSAA